VLKLRISIDEMDNVYRDIQIQSNQNFMVFHEALMKYFDIKKKKPACFFTSNSKAQKLNEISLGFDGAMDNAINGKEATIGSLLAKNINKFIYMNESTPQLTYLVEVKETVEFDSKKKYPICSKSVGSTSSMGVADDIFEDSLRIDDIL